MLYDWVAALGRQRGALPKDPSVVYPEDAWMKCRYRVPVAPTPSSGSSGQVVDGVLTLTAQDIGDVTWRELLRALAAYRLPADVRALMILVQGRGPRPFCTIYLSAELLRAFLQLPLLDRQSIMSAASSVSVDAAQAAITRAVGVNTAAGNPRQRPPAQQNPSGGKLDWSDSLSYNGGRWALAAAPVAALPPEAAKRGVGVGQQPVPAQVQNKDGERKLYELSYAITGEKYGMWSNFSFSINWLLDRPARANSFSGDSKTAGWIVQHVQVTFGVTDAHGKDRMHPLDDGKWNYYEAWPIESGHRWPESRIKGRQIDDTFSIQVRDVLKYTSGVVTIKAKAAFYPYSALPEDYVSNNPALFIRTNEIAQNYSRAGQLRASFSPPPETRFQSNVVDHSIQVRWWNWSSKNPVYRAGQTYRAFPA